MKSLCFQVLIISVSTVLVIGSSPHGNEETSPSVENDMEGEDEFNNELQEDYRNNFQHVHGFLNFLSVSMEQLKRQMESLQTQLRQSSENLTASIQRVEKVVTGGCIAKDLNSLTLFEYDRHASLKPIPSTGKSFNGSTLAEISSRIPTRSTSPQTLTVEFANRLDSTIDSFQIKQAGENAVSLPPEQIPGNTKEAFTFSTGSTYPYVAFSYLIPDPTFRLAVYARISYIGTAVGLAFLPSIVPISTYYANPGSFGEFIELRDSPTGSEKTILAKKNGLIAKAIFKETYKQSCARVKYFSQLDHELDLNLKFKYFCGDGMNLNLRVQVDILITRVRTRKFSRYYLNVNKYTCIFCANYLSRT